MINTPPTIKSATQIGIGDIAFMVDQILERPEAYIIQNPLGQGDEVIIPFVNVKQAYALKEAIRQFYASRKPRSTRNHVNGAMVGDNNLMEWDYDQHVRDHGLLPEEIIRQEKPEFHLLCLMLDSNCTSVVDALKQFREELSQAQAQPPSLPPFR